MFCLREFVVVSCSLLELFSLLNFDHVECQSFHIDGDMA